MIRNIAFVILFVVGYSSYVEGAISSVEDVIQKHANSDKLAGASWSFALMDVKTGKVIADHNKDLCLVPASTMKVITTATAFEVLGADYTFTTQIFIDGDVSESGVLQGDVIICGGNDPCLGSERTVGSLGPEVLLNGWVEKLEELGIKEVNGSIKVIPGNLGDIEKEGSWQYRDLGNYYAARPHGISYRDNIYYVKFKSGAPGTETKILETDPILPDLAIENKVLSGPANSGDNAYIYAIPFSDRAEIRGTIPPNRNAFSIKGALDHPDLQIGFEFASKIQSAGIELKDSIPEILPHQNAGEDWESIHKHNSPKAKAIMHVVNKRSFNLYAEHLFHQMAKEKKVAPASMGKWIASHWSKKGWSTRGVKITDGSGLSRTNLVSSGQMAQLLLIVSKQLYADEFVQTLPEAGKSGTLRSFGKGTGLVGNVRAKTGTMGRVKSYAGYLNDNAGNRYSFSLIYNHYSCKNSDIQKLAVELLNTIANLED